MRMCASSADRLVPAFILVDGRRSADLVKGELMQKVRTDPMGAEILAVGRQGIAVALEAAALARKSRSAQSMFFELSRVGIQELQASGVLPPIKGSAQGASHKDATDKSASGGAYKLNFSRDGWDSSQIVPKPTKIFFVSQSNNSNTLPLSKAIATEMRWLPEHCTLAVETLLAGKPRNKSTRMNSLARAVSQASEWQKTTQAKGTSRPFRCAAEGHQVDNKDAEAPPVEAFRLIMMPEGKPPPQSNSTAAPAGS